MNPIQVPPPECIIGCWFPDSDTNPPIRGGKFRPCVVLGVSYHIDKKQALITLCYGSGQSSDANVRQNSKASIEVQANPNKNSLTVTTRFDIDKYVTLPMTDMWFQREVGSTFPVKYGRLTPAEVLQLLDVMEQHKINHRSTAAPPTVVYKRPKVSLIKKPDEDADSQKAA